MLSHSKLSTMISLMLDILLPRQTFKLIEHLGQISNTELEMPALKTHALTSKPRL